MPQSKGTTGRNLSRLLVATLLVQLSLILRPVSSFGAVWSTSRNLQLTQPRRAVVHHMITMDTQGDPLDLTAQDPLFMNQPISIAIRYSADSGLKPYVLTVAKKIFESHPDIHIVEQPIAPSLMKHPGGNQANPDSLPTFEILVDDKFLVQPTLGHKDRDVHHQGVMTNAIFVSKQEIDLAIARAKRRRRTATTSMSMLSQRMATTQGEPISSGAATALNLTNNVETE